MDRLPSSKLSNRRLCGANHCFADKAPRSNDQRLPNAPAETNQMNMRFAMTPYRARSSVSKNQVLLNASLSLPMTRKYPGSPRNVTNANNHSKLFDMADWAR